MKNVLHVSSECYPAAKAGGMGDVVGALPAYLPGHGINASVVIPKYKTGWFKGKSFKTIIKGTFPLGGESQAFTVKKLKDDSLDFPFYCIDLPGLFNRDSIYLDTDGQGFKDEPRRNIAFQTAVMEWLIGSKDTYDVVHVHDHMTGLIPFFMKFCPRYESLKSIPTVLSIHNGSYRGEFVWDEVRSYLPAFYNSDAGVLDWDGKVNSLATAIKCAWAINTVSPQYMLELVRDSDTLTPLYETEMHKCQGILNGIDANLWDPRTDAYLNFHLKSDKKEDWKKFKSANKTALLKQFDLKKNRPLIGFIGRFAFQKGADLLVDAISENLKSKLKFNAFILGSGDKQLEQKVLDLSEKFPREIGAEIAYNEQLARNVYAGCDFLIMPSRFEPCGLNQLYSMRYGTLPIASNVGGLKDTVIDIADNGLGIVIKPLDHDGLVEAIQRAVQLYKNKKQFSSLANSITKLDYSWNNSAKLYANLYNKLIK